MFSVTMMYYSMDDIVKYLIVNIIYVIHVDCQFFTLPHGLALTLAHLHSVFQYFSGNLFMLFVSQFCIFIFV